MRGLSGKIAIVSGSYAEIGEAVAQRLAREGGRVILANSNRTRGEEAAVRSAPRGEM